MLKSYQAYSSYLQEIFMKYKLLTRVTSSILIAAAILTGCSSLSPTEDNTGDTEELSTEAGIEEISDAEKEIRYETYNKTYTNDNGQDLLSLSYTYPVLTLPDQPQAATAINGYFEQELKEGNAYGKDTLLPEATDFCEQDPSNFFCYTNYRKYDLMRCDERLISFFYLDSYSYGYNGSDFRLQGISFDGTTGEMLTLDDLASNADSLRDSLVNYILNQLKRAKYKNDLLYAPEECADVIRQDVLTDGNWYVSSAGICVLIPEGTVADPNLGVLQFTVPYQQLSGISVAYEYDGPFEMAGPLGTNLTADLDSNGDADAVYFDAVLDENDYSVRATLTVNGDNYSSLLFDENCYLTDGATYMLDYYLIDLDTSDPYIDLAIQDNGMSDDPVTYFFRYKDFQLQYMGFISDLISNPSFRWDGKGTFSCNMPLSLMITTDVTATYEVKKDQIRLVEQDWYELDLSSLPQDMQQNAILESFDAYTEQSRQSDTITLSPDDGWVQFTGTDNEHWVSFVTENGDTYYLYLTDFCTLESGQYTYDIFDSLYLVG